MFELPKAKDTNLGTGLIMERQNWREVAELWCFPLGLWRQESQEALVRTRN